MKKDKAQVNKLMKRLITLQKRLEKVKPTYEEIDKITVKLAKMRRSGSVLLETSNKSYVLQDNFNSKNTAYRVAAVKRFEVVEKKKAG